MHAPLRRFFAPLLSHVPALGALAAIACAAGGLALAVSPADVVAPGIVLVGANPATVTLGNGYVDAGALATDAVSGNVAVTPSGSVNPNAVGSYTLTYSASDGAGNTATATRTVNVVATPAWAENFNPSGVNGNVTCIAETPDAIYYGGIFSAVGVVPAQNVVRVDKLSGAVSALGSAAQNGTNGGVRALAVMGNNLYVGGTFSAVSSNTQNGIAAMQIAKWDLTAGTWAPLGGAQNGTTNAVSALAVIGSDLYVGGDFSTVSDGTQFNLFVYCIAKWDSVTNVWSSLGTGTNGANSVKALAAIGTDLYVGGSFTVVDSLPSANRVAKWDTLARTWSPLGSATQNGANQLVTALQVVGSDLYVGGSFTAVSDSAQSGLATANLAKWSTTGSAWATLGSAAQNGTNGAVTALAVSGGTLFAGGSFTTVSDSTQSALSANHLAKWDLAGSSWGALGSPTQNGTNGNVTTLLASGSDLQVGGAFTTVSSSSQSLPANHVAKWSGSSWSAALPASLGDGITGTVKAVVDAGTVVYVGGLFTAAGNVSANNVACWNKTTRSWSALGSATQNGTGGVVNALAVIGGDLYVGGTFSAVSDSAQNGLVAKNLAKWSATGASWSALGSATQNGTGAAVNALAVIGTNLYVGGSFTAASSATQLNLAASYVAKWSTTANTWAALGSGPNNTVSALAVMVTGTGTDLYVGGSFSTAGVSVVNHIAKWSTTASTWSPLGGTASSSNGTVGNVSALVVSGTDVYVGGIIVSVRSSTQNIIVNRIAKWSTTASTWAALGSATQNGLNSIVACLAVIGDDLYVGGTFTTASSSTQNTISANHLAKWSIAGSTWAPLGSATQNGTAATVNALAQIGGDLYVGGAMVTLSSSTQAGTPSAGLAIYSSPIFTPGIAVAQAGPLTDGLASVDFGTVTVASPSAAKIFTVTNSGSADLTGLAVSIDGANASDFTVSALSATSVAVGAGTATFSVTCNPASSGAKSAAIHIASNVTGTSNPFDIALSATGNSAPTFAGYAAGTPYQTAAAIALAKLLASAADAEGDALSVTAAGASAQGGTAVLQAGSILYTPAAGFSGSDSFPITISDARGASVTGTVSVTVQADSGIAGGGATNPPLLTVQPGGSIQLAFAGIPGRSYEIQRSSDLTNWLVIATVAAGPTGAVSFTDPSPPQPNGYYRLHRP